MLNWNRLLRGHLLLLRLKTHLISHHGLIKLSHHSLCLSHHCSLLHALVHHCLSRLLSLRHHLELRCHFFLLCQENLNVLLLLSYHLNQKYRALHLVCSWVTLHILVVLNRLLGDQILFLILLLSSRVISHHTDSCSPRFLKALAFHLLKHFRV